MRTQIRAATPIALAISALVYCALNLHAQSGPTITSQPASQTNLAGTRVTFTVEVDGTGPFSYQWQFNGTNLPSNLISTVAGKGTTGYGGDGLAATNASLSLPTGVALDDVGDLYIADTVNARVRRVNTKGIISTLAGNTTPGYSGDGGPATQASLLNPWGVALDASENLYIADSRGNRVRRVDFNGIITTVAGNGHYGYSGDAGVATNANLYVQAWPWMPLATCTLLTHRLTAFGRWIPMASSPPWRAVAEPRSQETAVRRPTLAWEFLRQWLWMPQAACTLPTPITVESEKWTPTASSRR